MVKALSYYDKEKIVSMNKKMQTKTLAVSIFLTVCMFGLGIANIISSFTEKGVSWMSLIIGILVLLFCLWPTLNAIKTGKKLVQNAVRDMHVEEHSLTIEYTFKEKRIEICVTQLDESKLDTIMMKNVNNARQRKDGIAFYLGNGDMYFILNDDFTEGDVSKLISLFRHNNIPVKTI